MTVDGDRANEHSNKKQHNITNTKYGAEHCEKGKTNDSKKAKHFECQSTPMNKHGAMTMMKIICVVKVNAMCKLKFCA